MPVPPARDAPRSKMRSRSSAATPAPPSATVMRATRPSADTVIRVAPTPWRSALSSSTSSTWPTVPREAFTSTFLPAATSSARREPAKTGCQRAACSCATVPRLIVTAVPVLA